MTKSICPICSEPAWTARQEIEHMEAKHPEVIEQRMKEAGFFRHPITHEWVDGRGTDD